MTGVLSLDAWLKILNTVSADFRFEYSYGEACVNVNISPGFQVTGVMNNNSTSHAINFLSKQFNLALIDIELASFKKLNANGEQAFFGKLILV